MPTTTIMRMATMRTGSMRTTIDQVRETLLGGPNCPHMMLSLENISCVYLMHTNEVLACVPTSTIAKIWSDWFNNSSVDVQCQPDNS